MCICMILFSECSALVYYCTKAPFTKLYIYTYIFLHKKKCICICIHVVFLLHKGAFH